MLLKEILSACARLHRRTLTKPPLVDLVDVIAVRDALNFIPVEAQIQILARNVHRLPRVPLPVANQIFVYAQASYAGRRTAPFAASLHSKFSARSNPSSRASPTEPEKQGIHLVKTHLRVRRSPELESEGAQG